MLNLEIFMNIITPLLNTVQFYYIIIKIFFI